MRWLPWSRCWSESLWGPRRISNNGYRIVELRRVVQPEQRETVRIPEYLAVVGRRVWVQAGRVHEDHYDVQNSRGGCWLGVSVKLPQRRHEPWRRWCMRRRDREFRKHWVMEAFEVWGTTLPSAWDVARVQAETSRTRKSVRTLLAAEEGVG